MTFMHRLCSFILLAISLLGRHRAEPLMLSGDASIADAPRAFSGSKARDERTVAGIKLCWCTTGRFISARGCNDSRRRAPFPATLIPLSAW